MRKRLTGWSSDSCCCWRRCCRSHGHSSGYPACNGVLKSYGSVSCIYYSAWYGRGGMGQGFTQKYGKGRKAYTVVGAVALVRETFVARHLESPFSLSGNTLRSEEDMYMLVRRFVCFGYSLSRSQRRRPPGTKCGGGRGKKK